jgi:hypothetical protein
MLFDTKRHPKHDNYTALILRCLCGFNTRKRTNSIHAPPPPSRQISSHFGYEACELPVRFYSSRTKRNEQEECDMTLHYPRNWYIFSKQPHLKTLLLFHVVKLSVCFHWAPRLEGVLGEWRYSCSTRSLTSALHGGEWSASRTCRFTPRERAPATNCIGGWVGPRAVLDAVVKRKILSP